MQSSIKAEQIEMATGRKLFVDDFGRALKIGCNDPRPCGSDKKFKKCCEGKRSPLPYRPCLPYQRGLSSWRVWRPW